MELPRKMFVFLFRIQVVQVENFMELLESSLGLPIHECRKWLWTVKMSVGESSWRISFSGGCEQSTRQHQVLKGRIFLPQATDLRLIRSLCLCLCLCRSCEPFNQFRILSNRGQTSFDFFFLSFFFCSFNKLFRIWLTYWPLFSFSSPVSLSNWFLIRLNFANVKWTDRHDNL